MLELMKTELVDFAHDVAARSSAARFSRMVSEDTPLPETIIWLADLTGETPDDLRYAFGRRLFERFTILYPDFIPTDGGVMGFLLGLERHIHDEIRVLYPDARPPSICCEKVDDDTLRIHYQSDQPVTEMCMGMLDAALAHFETRGSVSREAAEADADAVFRVSMRQSDHRAAA